MNQWAANWMFVSLNLFMASLTSNLRIANITVNKIGFLTDLTYNRYSRPGH